MTKKEVAKNAPAAMRKPLHYRRAIVTFLDILGFSELVRTGGVEDVARVLGEVRQFATREPDDEDETSAFSTSFSDSIVRVRFLDGGNREHSTGHVVHEILDLCHIQGELISRNVILRGAVTVGEIFFEDGVVFGPAMVKAYELETKAAIYPRVVLDPRVLSEVRADPLLRRDGHTSEEEITAIRKMVSRGDNGLWFVDYLRTMLEELDDPADWPSVLKAHKALVINRYSAPGSKAAYLDKLLWLALYQNKVVSEFPKKTFTAAGFKRGDFEVTTKDVPELARMPRRSKHDE